MNYPISAAVAALLARARLQSQSGIVMSLVGRIENAHVGQRGDDVVASDGSHSPGAWLPLNTAKIAQLSSQLMIVLPRLERAMAMSAQSAVTARRPVATRRVGR